jgi:hypothetical protein
MEDAFRMGSREYAELMHDLERSLFEDMLADEASFAAEHERREAEAQAADIDSLVSIHLLSCQALIKGMLDCTS